jgi:hypothetical protein
MRVIETQMNSAIQNEIDWKKDNTEVIIEGGVSCVYLYNKLIAKVGDTWIQLFDGGRQSPTTKSRLNAILSAHGIGSEGVYQQAGTWFFRDAEGGKLPFFSGMRIN